MIDNIRELIEKLAICEQAGNSGIRVQIDEKTDGEILPIQSVEIGVDGRAYIRCFRKG